MIRNEFVSVILIFYNAERFLSEAVESVLRQTCDRWELLLVDDGSTDHSTAIAQDYAKRFPEKIRYLQHEAHQNLGKSSSRNLGINAAKGDTIVFLDADDVLLPHKLEHQAAFLAAHPEAAMVYGTAQYWYSWTGQPKDQRRDKQSRLGVPPGALMKPPALATRYLKDGGIVPCLCSLMVRRQVFDEIGGFDESIQHLYEDQVLLFKICLNYPVIADENCGEKYRQHIDSSSYLAVKNGEYHPLRPNPARLAFLGWLSRYILDQGIEDSRLRKTLQRGFWPYRKPGLYRLARPFFSVWQLFRVGGGFFKRWMTGQ